MAMGVPVLTNNIGIEGIEVDDGIHYYHCETPEDYNGKIRYIIPVSYTHLYGKSIMQNCEFWN